MNTVAIKQEVSETNAVLAMIERVAMSPDSDLDKLEKMIDMQERILNRNARQEFASAMAFLQAELPEVERTNKSNNNMYAKFEDILAAIKPHLINHGFAITHRCNNTNGAVVVTAVLSHRSGHSEETSVTLPPDTSGSKNAVQAIGSSMEYGRRYTMNALLGIATKNADTDGSAALTGSQVKEMQTALLANKVPEADLLKKAQVTKIGEIHPSRYNAALGWVNRGGKAQ